MRHVASTGINVGEKTKMKMVELTVCFKKLGYGHVQAYGNSGNVIFTAASTDPRQLEAQLEDALATTFSSSIGVFVRSLADMQEVMKGIPTDWQASSERTYDIIFLHQRVDHPSIVQDLGPNPGIEDLRYQPGVLFWSIPKRDFSKSHLSKIVGTALYQDMTVRGPGTTRKVYALMSMLSESP
jgi:uncharacterized protein (DUF1697 family)